VTMNRLTRQVMASLIQAHGVTAADLLHLAGGLSAESPGSTTSPLADGTVRGFHARAVAACPPKSLPTYRIGFQRLVDAHGETSLGEVTPLDLTVLRDRIRRQVGQQRVTDARARGRLLRSSDPDAYGRGAAENFVRAVRFFFRCAVLDGRLEFSPAADLRAPRRPDPPERPLTDEELAELQFICAATGDDPELDALLFEFLRHTACRREGALNLRVGDVHARDCRVTVTEKNGQTRDLPLRRDVIARLLAHAARRGAHFPTDSVFRYKTGRPLTRRRFNTLFDRLDKHTSWSQPLDVGPHWIRHTTLDDVRRVADVRVAQSYAGHRDEASGAIGRYTKPTFDELIAAYEAIFGPRC
jgi:site-specific recombinase XerC